MEPDETEESPTTTPLQDGDQAPEKRSRRVWRRLAFAFAVLLFAGLIASNVVLWLRAEDARRDLRAVEKQTAQAVNLDCGGFDEPGFCTAMTMQRHEPTRHTTLRMRPTGA